MSTPLDTEQAVRARYSQAANAVSPQLCCPVDYETRYLDVIPQEVIERDYGCGDPSRYVRPGETVLDLGSGGGKICFIAAQVVGESGKVIGVDMNDDMLELARRSQPEVASRIGYDNVVFHKGKIQDLAIDRDRVDSWLKEHPITDEASLTAYETYVDSMRQHSPMIPDNSIDVVVSNCVLNLVDGRDKERLFAELFRVLKPGGRAVISDIVSDEAVPESMQQDAELWSGCISGAFQESEFLAAFQRAGFYGIEMPVLQREPWQTVKGIEFRSATVIAYKGKEGPCNDHHHAVIYRGPFRQVVDDDGHVFVRGLRTAVCQKTYRLMTRPPYESFFVPVPPYQPVLQGTPMRCDGEVRSPRVTKGQDYDKTTAASDCCDPGEGCC